MRRFTKQNRRPGRSRLAILAAAAASTFAVAGCATGPGAPANGSRYKGDAVWNIAESRGAVPTVAQRRG